MKFFNKYGSEKKNKKIFFNYFEQVNDVNKKPISREV